MFGIGSSEFVVIILVAILVLGPEHLPRIMRTIQKFTADFRRMSTEFQRAVNLENHQEEFLREQRASAAVGSVKKKKKKKAVPPPEPTAPANESVEVAPAIKSIPLTEPDATAATDPSSKQDDLAGRPPRRAAHES